LPLDGGFLGNDFFEGRILRGRRGAQDGQ